MLEFKKITFEDYDILKDYLCDKTQKSCELAFINLALWQKAYNNMYALCKGQLIIKSGEDENELFRLPLGDDFDLGIKLINDYCYPKKPIFFAQEGERLDYFLEHYGQKYLLKAYREDFDYIYLSQNLSKLKGKKYQSKRNHISSFSRKYDWQYQKIDVENIEKIKECAEKWYIENNYSKNKYLEIERNGVLKILSDWNSFDVIGGAVFVNGDAVAFTIGSKINDEVFDINIEKALKEYANAYAVINNQFVINELSEYKYVNREDDLGQAGLRKAKLSYKPTMILKKYCCTPDINRCIEIYNKTFNDEKEFTERLFSKCHKYCRGLKEINEIVSMLFLLPVTLNYEGNKVKAKYLYAAATDSRYRNRGYMRRLIDWVFEEDSSPIFLKPADESLIEFYKKLGFETVTATKAENSDVCLIPENEFAEISSDCNYLDENYTLMYHAKDKLDLDGISFPFTME